MVHRKVVKRVEFSSSVCLHTFLQIFLLHTSVRCLLSQGLCTCCTEAIKLTSPGRHSLTPSISILWLCLVFLHSSCENRTLDQIYYLSLSQEWKLLCFLPGTEKSVWPTAGQWSVNRYGMNESTSCPMHSWQNKAHPPISADLSRGGVGKGVWGLVGGRLDGLGFNYVPPVLSCTWQSLHVLGLFFSFLKNCHQKSLTASLCWFSWL